jgi:hypothetical protein
MGENVFSLNGFGINEDKGVLGVAGAIGVVSGWVNFCSFSSG